MIQYTFSVYLMYRYGRQALEDISTQSLISVQQIDGSLKSSYSLQLEKIQQMLEEETEDEVDDIHEGSRYASQDTKHLTLIKQMLKKTPWKPNKASYPRPLMHCSKRST